MSEESAKQRTSMLKYRVRSTRLIVVGPGLDRVHFFCSGLGFGLRIWQYGESWTMSPRGSRRTIRQRMPLATRPGMSLVTPRPRIVRWHWP